MVLRRRVGLSLAAVGVLLIAGGGVIWSREARELKHLAGTRALLEDSVVVLRAEIRRTNELRRGFQQSMPSMPDTVRRYGGKQIMEIGTSYTKRLRTLNAKERDVTLGISATRLRGEAVKKRAVSSSTPFGIAGLVALMAGLVLARTARPRPVGA